MLVRLRRSAFLGSHSWQRQDTYGLGKDQGHPWMGATYKSYHIKVFPWLGELLPTVHQGIFRNSCPSNRLVEEGKRMDMKPRMSTCLRCLKEGHHWGTRSFSPRPQQDIWASHRCFWLFHWQSLNVRRTSNCLWEVKAQWYRETVHGPTEGDDHGNPWSPHMETLFARKQVCDQD